MAVFFINTPFKGLKLGYTNNTQGFSKGSFSKLNLSNNVRDNPSVVERNRNLFKSYIDADIKWLKQDHTNIVKRFDECETEPCDAVFSDKSKQVCAILTADCLPVLIFDKKLAKVAAIHAGWKGLANGVLESTLKEFKGLDMVAWFGPCITQKYFEVGQDVYDAFIEQNATYTQAFISNGDNKYFFDMKFVAKQILNQYNCIDVVDSGFCTYSNKKFYSHRKDGGVTGRQASFIWID